MARVTLLALIATSDAASMNVHSIVGYRAFKYHASVTPSAHVPAAHATAHAAAIRENLPSVLGGADFPDFLYACGKYEDHHDAGEAAHWPVFHAAAVSYVRETVANFSQPASWSPATRELLAFIFGLTVHYVTDELWEGLTSQLGQRRGFTEMIDAFNLGNTGHGNTAEGLANMGGDFYASWTLDESGIDAWNRSFPLEDLVNIYHRTPKNASANFTDVTLKSLSECRVLFDLGLWALQASHSIASHRIAAGARPERGRLYARPVHRAPVRRSTPRHLSRVADVRRAALHGVQRAAASPAVRAGVRAQEPAACVLSRHLCHTCAQEQLFEAPLAGIDDMSAFVTFAWARLATWLEVGAPAGPPPRTDAEMYARAAADDADDRSTHALLSALRPFVGAAGALRAAPPHVAREWFALESAPSPLGWAAEGRRPLRVRYRGPREMRRPLTGASIEASHVRGRTAEGWIYRLSRRRYPRRATRSLLRRRVHPRTHVRRALRCRR